MHPLLTPVVCVDRYVAEGGLSSVWTIRNSMVINRKPLSVTFKRRYECSTPTAGQHATNRAIPAVYSVFFVGPSAQCQNPFGPPPTRLSPPQDYNIDSTCFNDHSARTTCARGTPVVYCVLPTRTALLVLQSTTVV